MEFLWIAFQKLSHTIQCLVLDDNIQRLHNKQHKYLFEKRESMQKSNDQQSLKVDVVVYEDTVAKDMKFKKVQDT